MYKYLILLAIAASPPFSQNEVPEPIWTAKYNARDVAFSPDGNLLAIGNDDYKAYIVNSYTGEVLQELLHEDGWPASVTNSWITNVAFTPDGQTLLTVSSGRNIFFWDTETWQKYDSISFDPENFSEHYIEELDISNNAKYLALSMLGGGFGIIDLETKDFRNWDDADYFVASGQTVQYGNDYVSISYDNKYIMASFSGWKRVKIFDIETLEEVKEYRDARMGNFNPVKDEFIIQGLIPYQLNLYTFNNLEDYETYSNHYFQANFNFDYTNNGKFLLMFGSISCELYDFTNDEVIVDLPAGGAYFDFNSQNNIAVGHGPRVFNLSNYLSIDENPINQLIVSPNPTDSIINIQYNFTNPSEFTISLNDITGNQIEIIDSGFGNGNYQNQFDLSHLASGTYFLTLTVNGENITKQIVKE